KREYRYTLKELGIVYDLNSTISDIFANHGAKKNTSPFLEFTPLFYEKVQRIVFPVSDTMDSIIVDEDNKTLRYIPRMEKYRIEVSDFKRQIVTEWFNSKSLIPTLIPLVDSARQREFLSNSDKLRDVSKKPITIVVADRASSVAFSLSPEDIQKMMKVDYDEIRGQVSISLKEDVLSSLLKNKIKLTDFTLDLSLLENDLSQLALNRFNGEDINYVEAKLTESPNTNGTKADKYIEIDISQQRMYIWENGANIARYRVSTGLYYPTPPGEYAILNKAPNAYSDIYNVWMPYWMAFYRDPKVNAYLGIHELPYYYTGNGDQIRRPRDFIGSPHTGGCVSLDLGEAEKVYAWAEVGTKVYVYE
ncbi:MAG: L,D-transpeptidase, partial [Patescibacteria group bacterium]